MSEASTNQLKNFPKLESLLVDADVDPCLIQYLRVVGFNAKFVLDVKVNVHDDAAIIRWAREHNRIVVCHDKYKDRETKFKVFQEIYEHGGHAIQISRGSNQEPLTCLGKLLIHHSVWTEFFKQNDGIVLIHQGGMKPMPRAYLIRQLQGIMGDKKSVIGDIPLKSPHPRKHHLKPKPISPDKPQLL